jgi:uncharacterized membrane protein YfhO
MNKYKKILTGVLLSATIIFSSCEDEKNEDLTQSVNKNGSVETSVTVEHLDSVNDILVTKHAVWYKGSINKTFEHRDTVPALGSEKTDVKDDFGNDKNVESKKEYEIFITVK